MRARLRFFFSPSLPNTRAMDFASSAKSLLAERTRRKRLAMYGTAPRPPPTYISKPNFFSPFSVRAVAMKPTSCKLVRPHAC